MSILKSYLNKKVLIKPQGFLDSLNAGEIITPLDIENFTNKKIKYVSVDFSKIISANISGVRFLNDIFEHLYKKNIECAIFSPNKNAYDILLKIPNRFFNIYENEEVEKLFTSEELIADKNIYICCIGDEQNKNFILFNLIKKGYMPLVINNEEKINKSNSVIIRKSVVSKFADTIGAVTKNDIVYFFFDGFLDSNISDMFDIEYFRRSLLTGFRIFIFDMNNVKGLNAQAIKFFYKLGTEAAEYGALLAIMGLKTRGIQRKLLEDLELAGFLFFPDEESFKKSEEVKNTKKMVQSVYKKKVKVTRKLVEIFPYFIKSTVESIELLTGIKAEKEKVEISLIRIDKSKEYVSSSIGFYGDVKGLLILMFSERLSKKISKILLGEEIDTKEELVDMIGEFANIIVGNVKSEFQKEGIEIELTLPKVFADLDTLEVLVEDKESVEVKFDFCDEEFYIYLTK
jgi:CheY-specific phosphatase CheX/anti-anti-sigma regulatory factor